LKEGTASVLESGSVWALDSVSELAWELVSVLESGLGLGWELESELESESVSV
jgi:hypothetical protein